MKIKFCEGHCSNCGELVKVLSSNYVQQSECDLQAYKSFKNFSLEVCPECNYVNSDIFNRCSENIKQVINSNKYVFIKEYLYLKGLEDVFEDILNDYNANDYECFSLVSEVDKDFNNAYRSLFRAVELKEAIAKKSNLIMLEDKEDLDEEEIDDYKLLYNLLIKSCNENLEKLFSMYSKVEKTLFNMIVYIECLTKAKRIDEAKNIYQTIKHQLEFQDLNDYIKNLLF